MLLLLGFAVIGDVACTTADDDCCAPVACALCSATAINCETAAVLQPPSALVAASPTEISRPPTPDLSRLTPPPRPLA
jgi:hypothetical protein